MKYPGIRNMLPRKPFRTPRSRTARPAFDGPMETGLIAVDVDGTLIVNGEINDLLLEWITHQKSLGKTVMLWSARGREYAEEIAAEFSVEYLFDLIIGKPELIVDDVGWRWINFTRVIDNRQQLEGDLSVT